MQKHTLDTYCRLGHSQESVPDDRLQRFVIAWDGRSLLNPQIYRWTKLHYAREGVKRNIPDEHILEIPETFVCNQNSNRYLIYSPLAGVAAEVNYDALVMLESLRRQYPNPRLATMLPKQYQETVRFLKQAQFLQPKGSITCTPRMYRSRVDLCLTSACNMRCVYCFSSGGERPRVMSWEIAKAALDLTVDYALRKNLPGIEVAFQGDGEQFVAWRMMVKCTEYIKSLVQKQGLHLRIWSLTNGILTSEMIRWAVWNLDSLAISLDGPPEIQNAQRLLPNGLGSAPKVIETIRQIESMGGNYSLRATISKQIVGRMAEIVEYVIENFPKARSFVLDPLFPSYISTRTGWEAPRADEFVAGYLEAQRIADKAGLRLGYTGFFNMQELTGYHCDAWGIKLAVTPEGLISSCPIIATLEDPRADFCIYGRYSEGRFEYHWGKLRRIMRRNLANMPYCANCMVRWHCAGECYSRLMMVGNYDEPWRSFRCEINRQLLPYELLRRLENSQEANHA
ncbi:MAG: hypothetical protein WHS87_04980 [Anaerolineales bacterium]